MSQSWFDLLKHTPNSNILQQILDTPIVNYGRVIKVIDAQTVIVKGIVKSSLSENVYTVTLLGLSSALMEISVEPKIGDKVLLLFLQQFDPRMFVEDSVINPNARGYNRFSGVGILMSTVKRAAKISMRVFEAQDETILDIESAAKIYGTFTREVALRFERLDITSEDVALINILFAQGRPFSAQFLSKHIEEHGFWKDSENELVELDAAVKKRYSKYSPITRDIQGTQVTDVGLGRDKDDKPIETEAPSTEIIHGKAPVTKIIRSPQNIIIGIGNAETEDEQEQRDAPLNIELGEKADITLLSRSGRKEEFDKEVSLKSKENITLETGEKVEVKNATESLGAILSDFIQAVHDIITIGSPTTQTLNPATKTALQNLKTRAEALMEK
jgi:hypothetical protein